jgi:hypothetical protein
VRGVAARVDLLISLARAVLPVGHGVLVDQVVMRQPPEPTGRGHASQVPVVLGRGGRYHVKGGEAAEHLWRFTGGEAEQYVACGQDRWRWRRKGCSVGLLSEMTPDQAVGVGSHRPNLAGLESREAGAT